MSVANPQPQLEADKLDALIIKIREPLHTPAGDQEARDYLNLYICGRERGASKRTVISALKACPTKDDKLRLWLQQYLEYAQLNQEEE